MRNLHRILSLALSAAILTACGTSGMPGNAHPEGWVQQSKSGREIWVSPKVPEATYEFEKKPFDGDTKAFASSLTLDMVLKGHAKLQKTVAFDPCPGEAGLQRYVAGNSAVLVAFAVYDGTAYTATYTRPKDASDDPAVSDAMRKSVCTSGA